MVQLHLLVGRLFGAERLLHAAATDTVHIVRRHRQLPQRRHSARRRWRDAAGSVLRLVRVLVRWQVRGSDGAVQNLPLHHCNSTDVKHCVLYTYVCMYTRTCTSPCTCTYM